MTAKDIIRKFQLLPHPEGGFYKETYRSKEIVKNKSGYIRNVCTSIYYLLEKSDKSNFHKIKSDELWFFHQGESLEIIYIKKGRIAKVYLGNNINSDEVPQILIPANTWFAAKLRKSQGYSFVSCTVSPGFDFNDFELASRDNLINEYPDLKKYIIEFTEPS